MKKITLRRALLGLAAAAVAAVIVYKLIDLGPKLLTPKPPPGRIAPAAQGGLSGLLRRWRGDSAVLTFMANGVDPSFATRAACAAAVGIPDYTGAAEQNARLLDALGAGADPEKSEFLT